MRRGHAASLIFAVALLAFLAVGIRSAPEPALPRENENPTGGAALPGTYPAGPSAGFMRQAWTVAPATAARSILVADADNGEEFLRVRADAEWPIASLTKLMTAALVLERFDLSQEFVLREADFALGRNSMIGVLSPGEAYSGRDLLTLLLIPSANEAAEAFARTYGREVFIADMNSKAIALGLDHTSFADPSGISKENRSTAEDLMKLTLALRREYPDIFDLTRSRRAEVTELRSGARRSIENTHAFAGRVEFLGGKTGTTPFAGENLITVFSYGRPALIIVLGDTDRVTTTERYISWFTHDFSVSK